MGDPASEVPLPPSVEEMIRNICLEQAQREPDIKAREILASIGEQAALHMLTKISSATTIKTLTGYIIFLSKTKEYAASTPAESVFLSPQKRSATSVSSIDDDVYYSPNPRHLSRSPTSSAERAGTPRTNDLVFSSSSCSERARQLLILSEIEFRKTFLVLSYIGRNKVEDVMTVDDDDKILGWKDLPMRIFESKVWNTYGQHYLGKESPDRIKHLDWDSGKTHFYYCHVYQDGAYSFKGPYLNTTKTHLQRSLGDENVLIVKFEEEAEGSNNFAISSSNCNAVYIKIAEEGILVGLRRYHFFVFKDGGKEAKKKSPYSSAVKCYFVRMESIAPCGESKKTLHEARCLFMHLHMTDSMAKCAARFSLILSKTIKLQVDLASVLIEEIEDVPCRDENGNEVCDEDGKPLFHTDGTGYISEDLAIKSPNDFYNGKFIQVENFEPLLIQCRLFNNGSAVKGTLLVNRKLGSRTIQIRKSMIKVKTDRGIPNAQSFNSLEVVAISHKPRRSTLSKNLIALLSFGGVPKEFFLDLLGNALEDSHSVFTNKRAALRVVLNHEGRDDVLMARGMILSGVPLNEPCLQNCLSRLASEERKGLKGGKLPISESFYLMGTADPTGLLNIGEVCVILDNGQISGDVLVYRNPGLHFGDIHVLKAIYVKALEDVVGNAKYAIFFSIKGPRSAASEIADGDLDGDMYWVSKNPQLLTYYKASEPWKRIYSTPGAVQRQPSEFSPEQLQLELFRQFLSTRKQSNSIGVTADSWLSFMDRLLILGDHSADEKEHLKKKMLKLIDIYYDALDAAKTGKKVEVPNELKAEMYPHYMERGNEYHSTSVLGLIYDTTQFSQTETVSIEEIWKLPYFEHVEIPDACLRIWKGIYKTYKKEMTEVLNSNNESKGSSADDVIKKYKQMLYGAAEFEESGRKVEDIYNDALALYHATYDYANSVRDVGKCSFAWKVAGSALCKFYAKNLPEKSMLCVPSVLRELLY